MKWLLDEMLPPATSKHLITRGHDAVSVQEVELSGAEDERVFDFAVREQRIVVTENFADYALLLEHRIHRSRTGHE
jgi:predicted nuclease of predicted toxin-antitoxin system